MVKLGNRVEVLALLEEIAGLEDKLTPNEREMVAHLKEKYDAPGGESFDDKICLEVIVRNVGIRNSTNMKPSEAAARTIELPRKNGDD